MEYGAKRTTIEILLLSRCFYYKPIELRRMLESFESLEKIIEAPKDAFLNLGIRGKQLDEFLRERSSAIIASPSADRQAKAKQSSSYGDEIGILTILDKEYPQKLKHLCDAPPVLFYKGDLSCLENENCLAVIGSRKITEYGVRVTQDFVKNLCEDFLIVSGLAYGVDGLAHKITVEKNQRTIAVLGSGLDDVSIYPKSNLTLSQKIVERGGLLLSEVPPGFGAQAFHFPMRNRIIAGLSRGILIVEGGKKSGTLITAKLGIDYGADIFAVPNNIFLPNGEGVNYLIKCGAQIATSAQDILEFYGISKKASEKKYQPKTDLEKLILESLAGEPRHIDEIVELVKGNSMDIMETLTDLEMAGVVKNLGGQRFVGMY